MQLPITLTVGDVYRRRDLHNALGGQGQGGISTPRRWPVILLFTNERGQEFGYQDRWGPAGTFLYTGEGQKGNMQWVRGNSALRDHAKSVKDLAMFSETESAHHRFVGYFDCIAWSLEQRPDVTGSTRLAIVFELAPMQSVDSGSAYEVEVETSVNLTDLRRRAFEAAESDPTTASRVTHREYRRRSKAVAEYSRARANEACESCKQAAPFQTTHGTAYLEVHHILRLADDGPDDPNYVAAICPNCHREIHHGVSGDSKNEELKEYVTYLESGAR